MPQLLEYKESGIELLISYLSDRELIIREKADQLLKNVEHKQVQKETEAELLLNPGDKIYSGLYLNLGQQIFC